MSPVSELKERLVTACRILVSEGVMDEHGHFSVRCPETGGVLMNGKVSPGRVTEEDIILVDLEGNKLEGKLDPVSESPLHLAVFQRRPDVMAIAHFHSAMIVTLSIAGVGLRTVENQGASVIGRGAPVFEKYGLIDTFDLGFGVAESLGSHRICVLKSHGSIVVGGDIEETCVLSLWAERAALRQYQAMLLGEPDWYPEEELDRMREQEYRSKGHLKTWNYYRWKVDR